MFVCLRSSLWVSVCVCAGQVMTAGVAEILNRYSLKAILRQVAGEKQTRAAEDTNDDSYLGNTESLTQTLTSAIFMIILISCYHVPKPSRLN